MTYRIVKFEPWEGRLYGEGLWERRILIVGESHYDEHGKTSHSENRAFTQECVQDVVNDDYDKRARYWATVANRLGTETGLSRSAFWERVAFYNFVQTPLANKNARPSGELWKFAGKAFLEVLENLKPDRILITGSMMEPHLPSFKARYAPIPTSARNFTVGSYQLASGHCTYALVTGHPRSAYFPRSLAPALKSFVTEKPSGMI